MVSVVMPVYNTAAYLREAVDSILAQSLTDFELIAVNDGSTDASGDILEEYAASDHRVRVIHQSNKGIAAARNAAMDAARGEYLAVMDSDDVALPHRLERQVAFLKSHPNVGICGARCRFFGDRKSFVGAVPTCDAEETRCRLLFLPTLSHTSVMMRRSLVERGVRYDESLVAAEDYDLYVQALGVCDVISIPDVLMRIRTHGTSTTRRIARASDRTLTPVHSRVLRLIGVCPSEEELELHLSIANCEISASRKSVDRAEEWLLKLLRANRSASHCEAAVMQRVIFEKLCLACARGPGSWYERWRRLTGSPLYLGPMALAGYSMALGPRRLIRGALRRQAARCS